MNIGRGGGRTYPCCEHCADDQPHIEADTHDLPCDIGGCQVWSEADAREEIASLRAQCTALIARAAGAESRVVTLRAEVDDVKAMSGYQHSLGYDEGYRAGAALTPATEGDW